MSDPKECLKTNTKRRAAFRRLLGRLAAGAVFASLPMLAGTAQAQTRRHPQPQTAAAQTSSDEKPNILFIMGDDIG